MEEIGLAVKSPLEPLFKINSCAETGQEFVWVYRTQSEGPFTLNTNEIDEGRWLSPDDVTLALAETPEKYSPSFRLIWERLY